MSVKSLILKKGWAGKTISREETAERMNALIPPLVELLHVYNAVFDATDSVAADLSNEMPVLRADIGKLTETVHSCGAVAYSGTDLEPSAFATARGFEEILEREAAHNQALSSEKKIEHQMRTRAVLQNIEANSNRRVELIRRYQNLA